MNRSRPKGRAVALAAIIAVLWVVSTVLLLQRHYGIFPARKIPRTTPTVISEDLFKERWMGVYSAGEKVGYIASKLSRQSGGGYAQTETAFLRLKVLGVVKEIDISTQAWLDEGFRLESFAFELVSDVSMKAKGIVADGEVHVTLDLAGRKSERKIKFKERPYLSPTMADMIRSGDLRAGRSISLPMLDPSTLAYGTMDIKVLKTETITAMGKEHEAFKLRGMFKGAEILLWVTESGEVLREDSAGLSMVLEDKKTAMDIGADGPTTDLIARISIPFETVLPLDIRYLKIRLQGISLEGLELDGGGQSLTGNVLEINTPAIGGKNARLLSNPKKYLASDAFIQADDPLIIALAMEILPGEMDDEEKARILNDWVYENIKKTPALTVPSALEVLESRRGDCNEHTVLYTALARASGLPTRIAVGLAHLEGKFFYHAWPEVYLGAWVPVDPTLGQFPANAGHIRLLTGGIEKQIRLASIIGKLKILPVR